MPYMLTAVSDLDSKVHGLNLVLDNLVHEESRNVQCSVGEGK
jgi:hypothetical protein